MKIGLVLAYKGVNYGMLLQAYATQRIVEKLGFETEILDYSRTSFKHVRLTPWLLFYFFDELKRRRKMKERCKLFSDEIHLNNVQDRKNISNEFINIYLLHRLKCKGIDELEAKGKTYNGVIVGSDQIWPPDSAFGNFTTLRFVPDEVNKISYATSLGVFSYPFWSKSSAADFLKRINHISVREEQGKQIINGFSNVHVDVVVDPTYLLTKQEWIDLIPEATIIEDDYVLCYFLGNEEKHKKLAREYADKHKIKLVSILSTESFSDMDLSFADEIVVGKGPCEFINLIRHANVVMTDSFHGLAFSVINNVPFYIYYRTKVGSTGSRNSRIDNVLKMWGLESRLMLDDSNIKDFDSNPINYDKVNESVKVKREYSKNYLIAALKDCK